MSARTRKQREAVVVKPTGKALKVNKKSIRVGRRSGLDWDSKSWQEGSRVAVLWPKCSIRYLSSRRLWYTPEQKTMESRVLFIQSLGVHSYIHPIKEQ